jgi:DNA polymerase-3 subunit epsilon
MLKDLHRCDAVCDGTQSPTAYAEVVARARTVLRDPTELLLDLRERMHGLAAEGAFERAAECREQLAAVVRAFDARRHLDLLRGTRLELERTVVSHDGPRRTTSTEVVELSDGALVATRIEPAGTSRSTVVGSPLGTLPDTPPDSGVSPTVRPREEADLLRRWIASDGVVVRRADGACASPVAGGALLAAVRAELQAAGRATRGDEVILTRAKVRRRTTDAVADTAGDTDTRRISRERDPRPT